MPFRVNSAWNSFPRHVPATCPSCVPTLKFQRARPPLHHKNLKVGTHEGTCCRGDKSHRVNARFSWKILLRGRNFVRATYPQNWDHFDLRGHFAATKYRYTPVTRKVASCEVFMQHVPATLQKNKPFRKRNHDMSLRQGPSVWTLQETYLRNMPFRVNSAWNSFPRHVPATCPSCVPTLKFQSAMLPLPRKRQGSKARCPLYPEKGKVSKRKAPLYPAKTQSPRPLYSTKDKVPKGKAPLNRKNVTGYEAQGSLYPEKGKVPNGKARSTPQKRKVTKRKATSTPKMARFQSARHPLPPRK